MKATTGAETALAMDLRGRYGMSGILVQMAERGQLLELRCEMPKCYCFKGRSSFDPVGSHPDDWVPSADHYPILKSQGGELRAWNVRLGHKLCNNRDYGWRSRIVAMLKKGMSLAEIAKELNGKQITPPHGQGSWTAKAVRKAFVS